MTEPRTGVDALQHHIHELEFVMTDVKGAIDALMLMTDGDPGHNGFAYIAGQLFDHERRCRELLDAAFAVSAKISREVA